jgi:hypothetical protein
MTMVAAPRAIAVPWLGRDGRRTSAEVLTRATGARDAALGLGTTAALLHHRDGRSWVMAQMASDAGDLAATLLAGNRVPAMARRGVVAMAGTAIASGLAYLLVSARHPDVEEQPQQVVAIQPT